ncbi:MAG: DUF2442 domain-containing protein [Planctomycetes bacterium]|nr:DUF2442 domain-containing protein [Planctomycetota bacterium]
MSSSTTKARDVAIIHVGTTDDTLTVDLSDGRSVSAPLGWYPRLAHATEVERRDWRLIAGGSGIHWPQLDEDISVQSLLDGRPSTESDRSLQKWLAKRTP